MTDWKSLGIKDMFNQPVPKPIKWDESPELFDQDTGHARRIAGPRDARMAWGPIVWRRNISEYEIVCMLEDSSTYGLGSQERHGCLIFHAFVGGEKVDTSWHTLDECLVDMVRYKHEGRRGSSGPRATEYFLKMIGAPEVEV